MLIVKQGRVNIIVVKKMTSWTGKIIEGNIIYFRSPETQNVFFLNSYYSFISVYANQEFVVTAENNITLEVYKKYRSCLAILLLSSGSHHTVTSQIPCLSQIRILYVGPYLLIISKLSLTSQMVY